MRSGVEQKGTKYSWLLVETETHALHTHRNVTTGVRAEVMRPTTLGFSLGNLSHRLLELHVTGSQVTLDVVVSL